MRTQIIIIGIITKHIVAATGDNKYIPTKENTTAKTEEIKILTVYVYKVVTPVESASSLFAVLPTGSDSITPMSMYSNFWATSIRISRVELTISSSPYYTPILMPSVFF